MRRAPLGGDNDWLVRIKVTWFTVPHCPNPQVDRTRLFTIDRDTGMSPRCQAILHRPAPRRVTFCRAVKPKGALQQGIVRDPGLKASEFKMRFINRDCQGLKRVDGN